MKNLKNKLKNKLKNNKKGFTLVEIIVVLVILAVLAAAAIPTMLGFVEDAKGKAEIANARAAYIAAQSIATEEYAAKTANDISGTYVIGTASTGTDQVVRASKKLNTMLNGDLGGAKIKIACSAGKVTKLEYLNNPAKYVVTIIPNETASIVESTTLT